MNKQAEIAIRAAKMTKQCGRHAMMVYCMSRHVPLRLWYLARMLQAANSIEVMK